MGPTDGQPNAAPSGAAQETTRDGVWALLAGQRDAVVAALSESGFRIALPEEFPLAGHRALSVPPARETMLHYVIAADRMAVVGAWERARENGVGVADIHALAEPDTPLVLTVADARKRYGVWLAVLTHHGETPRWPPDALTRSRAVPSRPRRATMHKSLTAIITALDADVTGMLGWAPAQMVGSRSTEFIHREDRERAVASWMELLASQTSQRVRLRHRCADGTWLWVEVEHIHNGAEDPDEVDVVAHINDISDEMAAHEAIRQREQLFSRLAESLPVGILQLRRDRSIAYANARLAEILGSEPLSALADLCRFVVRENRRALETAIDVALTRCEDSEMEVGLRGPHTNSTLRCMMTITALTDQEGEPGALICVNDVTEGVRLREQLTFRATHDPLTGCLNRSAVLHALEDRLAQPSGNETALIFIDVDEFKPVNDQLGHAAATNSSSTSRGA